MAIAEINEWLNGARPFAEGLKLYHRYCGEPTGILSVLLKGPQNSFVLSKLSEALQLHNQLLQQQQPEQSETILEEDLVETVSEETEKEVQIYKQPIAPKARHRLGFTKGYPKHLVDLDKTILINLRELDRLRGQMQLLPEGESLRLLATSIVLLDREISQNYEALHYWVRHGQTMPGTDPTTEKQQYALMMKAIKTHPPYINKYQNSSDSVKKKEADKRKLEMQEINKFIDLYA